MGIVYSLKDSYNIYLGLLYIIKIVFLKFNCYGGRREIDIFDYHPIFFIILKYILITYIINKVYQFYSI